MKEIKVMYAEIEHKIGHENYTDKDIAFEKDGRLWIGRGFWEPEPGTKIKKVIKGVVAVDAVRAIVMGYEMLRKYSSVYPDTLELLVDGAWMSGFSKE